MLGFWQPTFPSRATPQENPFHFPSRRASKIACLSFSMMVKEVREAMDEGNRKFFGGLEYHIPSTVTSEKPLVVREQSLQLAEA